MKKKRTVIFVSLGIYALILLIVSVLVLSHVRTLLVNYEQAQPESAVERQISRLQTAAAGGELDQVLTLSGPLKTAYDPDSPLFRGYISLLKSADLTYRRSFGGQEDCVSYDLLADGTKIATLNMKSRNERTDLFVFQSAEWYPVSLDPVIYTCDLTLPQELTLKLYDIPVSGQPGEEEGDVFYHLESLSRLELSVSDEAGNVQRIEDGSAPSVYIRGFTLPDELTVRLNGRIVEGRDAGNHTRSYRFCGLEKPDLTVEDRYGHSLAPDENAELKVHTFSAVLPTDYKISVGGVELSRQDFPVERFEMYDYFAKAYEKYFSDSAFADAPGVVTYTFTCLMTGNAGKDVVITAPDGSSVPFDPEAGTVAVRQEPVRTGPIPKEIGKVLDVKKFAETWSYFLHGDLSGSRHGFSTMAKYLIPGSDFYKDCYDWAAGPDIGLVSGHTPDRVPFTDEFFGGYMKFGDNCFICDIRLNLHITLTKTGKKLVRPLNRTVCFVRLDLTDDGADNPGWYALACWDIVESEAAQA